MSSVIKGARGAIALRIKKIRNAIPAKMIEHKRIDRVIPNNLKNKKIIKVAINANIIIKRKNKKLTNLRSFE